MRYPPVVVALGVLSVAILLAPIAVGQDAPEVPARPIVDVDVFLKDSGCAGTTFCIEFATGVSELALPPDAQVNLHVHNIGGSDHDLTFGSGVTAVDAADDRPREDDGSTAVKTPLLAAGESYTLSIIMPHEGSVDFVCSVAGHGALGMVGKLFAGGAAAGEEAPAIEDYGVSYWAYWVGVISFVILFIMLFVLYFVLRYGDTKEAVDHRTGATKKAAAASSGHAHAEAHDNSLWMALLVGVIFTLILIIAVILGGGA